MPNPNRILLFCLTALAAMRGFLFAYFATRLHVSNRLLRFVSLNKNKMQTEFKKGDRFEVVGENHPLLGLIGTVLGQVNEEWVSVIIDNDPDGGADLMVEDIKLINIPATASPRLASEMTLRDRYELAKEIYIGLITSDESEHFKVVNAKEALRFAAKASVEAADALIQALNEKP